MMNQYLRPRKQNLIESVTRSKARKRWEMFRGDLDPELVFKSVYMLRESYPSIYANLEKIVSLIDAGETHQLISHLEALRIDAKAYNLLSWCVGTWRRYNVLQGIRNVFEVDFKMSKNDTGFTRNAKGEISGIIHQHNLGQF